MFTYYLWKSYFKVYNKNNMNWHLLDTLVFALPFEIITDLLLLPIEIIFSVIIMFQSIKKKKVMNWKKKQMKI